MKASRSVARWQASIKSLVGACSRLSAPVIQPVHAHGDVKGDGAMPDTSSAMGVADDGLSVSELRLLHAMGIPHRLRGISY